MNLYILQQYQFIQNLYQDETYLDVLMNVDDFFDILNLYAYPNWYECEVVNMKCMKHFTNVILKQDRDKMPHPKGGILLSKYDCIVKYKKTTEYLPKEYEDIEDMEVDPKTGKKYPKMEEHKVWLIDILIPNKHIINDVVYDLESIQRKIEDKKEIEGDNTSITVNGDTIGPDDNQQESGQGM